MKEYGKTYEFSGAIAEILLWLAMAKGEQDYLDFTEVVHVEDAHGIVSDGRRIHIAELPAWTERVNGEKKECKIEPGDYKIIAMTRKSITLALVNDSASSFPNWRRVMPEGLVNSFETHESGGSYSRLRNTGRFLLEIYHRTGRVLDITLLKPLCGNIWRCRYVKGEERRALQFENRDASRIAVIMPMEALDGTCE